MKNFVILPNSFVTSWSTLNDVLLRKMDGLVVLFRILLHFKCSAWPEKKKTCIVVILEIDYFFGGTG